MTAVKIQGEEVDMVQCCRHLGAHINNRLDRTNKTYCSRCGRIVFLRTITAISGGQHTFPYSAVQEGKQHSDGCSLLNFRNKNGPVV